MKRVALLLETSRAYGRGLLRGVAQYNREHARWSVCFQPHGLDDPPPPWLRNWKGDGILARIGDRRCGFTYTQYLARAFRKSTGQTLSEYRKQARR